jgi:hypothetical protein
MPRRSERVLYNGDIKLDWSSGIQETRISDISVDGCYIDSTSAVTQGEIVAFELIRPDGDSIRFTGTVAYVLDGFGFGVHFTDVTDEQKAVVQQILANH